MLKQNGAKSSFKTLTILMLQQNAGNKNRYGKKIKNLLSTVSFQEVNFSSVEINHIKVYNAKTIHGFATLFLIRKNNLKLRFQF